MRNIFISSNWTCISFSILNFQNDENLVMASCTEISLPDEKMSSDSLWNQQISSGVPKQIHARDCINGTLMPKTKFSSPNFTNYTEVNHVFQEHGLNFRLDGDIKKIPHDTDITIYPKTKVNF